MKVKFVLLLKILSCNNDSAMTTSVAEPFDFGAAPAPDLAPAHT